MTIGLVLFAGYSVLATQLPDLDALNDIHYQSPMRVYSRDGLLIGEFGEKIRYPVTLDEVPKPMIQAFLSAEDDRFFEHPGFDYQGLLRASLTYVITGEKRQGGSTITMQVARNFYLSREKTLTRKFNEMLLAFKIESSLSKSQILELYINQIYLNSQLQLALLTLSQQANSIPYNTAGYTMIEQAMRDPIDAALNFGLTEHMDHAERYARAREFYDVVTGLWDSWADDAFVRDVDSGRFFDPAKLHVLGHKGEHLSVRGPLHIARPVQGWPVIVQAGASEAGKQLAAETAEAVFTALRSAEEGRAFYKDVKGRAVRAGRNPDHMKILPACFVVVGDTVDEAKAKRAKLDSLVNYANADMVGHTGILSAAVRAVETIDACLARLEAAVVQAGGVLFITADHGNAELMRDYEHNQPHNAHTLYVVPAILVNGPPTVAGLHTGQLADVALLWMQQRIAALTAQGDAGAVQSLHKPCSDKATPTCDQSLHVKSPLLKFCFCTGSGDHE